MAGKKKKSSNKWKRSLFQSPIPEGRPVRAEELEETVHNQEPPSTPENHPIQQVIVQEEAQPTVHFALNDEADEDLSLALSSNRTARLAALFPNKGTTRKFKEGSTLL